MIQPPSREELEIYRDIPRDKIIKTYIDLMNNGEINLARKLRCYASYWDRILFVYFYMTKWATSPFKDYHDDILHAIPHGARDRRINILAPRGSAKSTMCVLVYPLHRILYAPFDEVMGYDIEKFIIVITVSEGKMKTRFRDLMRPLSDPDSYRNIHDDFGDRSDTGVWSVSEFHARLGIDDEIAVVRGMSRGKEVRGELEDGSRPTLFLIDDIDSVEDLLNPESRAKDQDWFFAGVMQAGVPEMSNFIMIDTLKHEESLAAIMRGRAAWETIFLRAFDEPPMLKPHPTAEPLWEQWENIYTNMSLKKRRDKADAFYEEHKKKMNEGVDGLWPERITYRLVRSKILDEGYDFTMREYQNDISLTSFRMFNMGKAATFTIQDDGLWIEDERLGEEGVRHVKWDGICGVSIYHDWAGGQDISKNDYSAVVMVAWSNPIENVDEDDIVDTLNGQYAYVLNAVLERSPPDRQIASIFDMAEYAMDTLALVPDLEINIGYEEIVDGTGRANPDYKRSFMREKEKRGNQCSDLVIRSVPQARVRKEARIDSLAGPINYGWISFNQNLNNEFRKQLAMYPTGDHDDGPDALEGATKMRLRPTGYDATESEYDANDGLSLQAGGRW